MRNLHLAAFTLPALTGPLEAWSLSFPETWRAPLLALEWERNPSRRERAVALPIRTLNAAIAAFVPDLLAAPAWVGANDRGRHWLVADAEIPRLRIWKVVAAWMAEHYDTLPGYATAFAAIRPEDLRWQRTTLPVTPEKSEIGTATPPSLAYGALPALLAEQLVDGGVRVPIGGETRSLRRVAAQLGSELHTWPPVYLLDDEDNRWGYSYVIRLSLQTVVGDAHPRLYAHYGVRRWTSSPLRDGNALYLSNRARSAYIAREGYGVCAATRLMGQGPRDKREAIWADALDGIAARLNTPLPKAEEIVQAPLRYLESTGGGVSVAIVEQQRTRHPVNAGLGLELHKTLTALLEQSWESARPHIVATDQLRLPVQTGKHPLLADDLRDVPVPTRLAGFEQSVGSNVTIEVWWQTEPCRDVIIDRVQALLTGARPELADTGGKRRKRRETEPAVSTDETLTIPLPAGGRLQIVPRRLGMIGDSLAPSAAPLRKLAERAAYKRQATEARMREISEQVALVAEPTLTIIELADYRADQGTSLRDRDPKRALRAGLARVGRITKFTTGQKEDLTERCENAVLEGLRQLGYLPAPIDVRLSGGGRLPAGLVVAAVHVLRLTRSRSAVTVHLPLVLLFAVDVAQVFAWIPDGKPARPLYEALIDITALPPEQVRYGARDQALSRLEHFLTHELPATFGSEIAILVEAQNIRSTWTWLQNGLLEWDALRVRPEGPRIAIDGREARYRLIRLRTSGRDETPEWFTEEADPGRGYAQGLWRDPQVDRMFYSVGEKPHTQGRKRKGKQANPEEQYAIPSALEVLVAARPPSESPEQWAKATHIWRRMGYLTGGMTLLPIMLQWARRVDRYASVIGPWVFDDWIHEEPVDGDQDDTDDEAGDDEE